MGQWIDPESLIRKYCDEFDFLHSAHFNSHGEVFQFAEKLTYTYNRIAYYLSVTQHPASSNDPRFVLKCLRVTLSDLVQNAANTMRAIVKSEFRQQSEFIDAFQRIKSRLPSSSIILYGLPDRVSVAFSYSDVNKNIEKLPAVNVTEPQFDETLKVCCSEFLETVSKIESANAELQKKYLWAEKYLDDKRRVRYTVGSFVVAFVSLIIVQLVIENWSSVSTMFSDLICLILTSSS